MAVYVDGAKNTYGRMIMSHMVADTWAELHAMAEAIGVSCVHFQHKASTPHYDICQRKRTQALHLGAVEVDRHELVQVIKRLRTVAQLIPIECPACYLPHIDRGEWATRLHKKHLCEHCGKVWQPYTAYTVGIIAP